MPDVLVILPFLLVGAALYASVGHGGATVYLAILTVAGFAVDVIVTSVLALNVLVAGVAFLAFRQAGHLRWDILLPFAVTGVPFAYLGGRFPFNPGAQEILIGVVLAAAAARFLLVNDPPRVGVPRTGWAFKAGAPALGAVLGFLAGATGIGGGLFLSPVLLVLGWGTLKEAASVASAFIVVNSLAGLAARLPRAPLDPALVLPLAGVVLVGGVIGALLGARKLPPRALQVVLGVVLLVGAARALTP